MRYLSSFPLATHQLSFTNIRMPLHACRERITRGAGKPSRNPISARCWGQRAPDSAEDVGTWWNTSKVLISIITCCDYAHLLHGQDSVFIAARHYALPLDHHLNLPLPTYHPAPAHLPGTYAFCPLTAPGAARLECTSAKNPAGFSSICFTMKPVPVSSRFVPLERRRCG
jgi:hypothetical protein